MSFSDIAVGLLCRWIKVSALKADNAQASFRVRVAALQDRQLAISPRAATADDPPIEEANSIRVFGELDSPCLLFRARPMQPEKTAASIGNALLPIRPNRLLLCSGTAPL
jgi:hypothetical protein